MLSGATESVLVRPLGIVAYGFTPLLATPEEVATAHGDDERVREDTVRRSLPILYEVVSELCRRRLSACVVPRERGIRYLLEDT